VSDATPNGGNEVVVTREVALTGALWLAIIAVGALGCLGVFSFPLWEAGATQALTILASIIGAILGGKFALSSPTNGGKTGS